MTPQHRFPTSLLTFVLMAQFAVSAADAPSSAQLPRPDGKPADHTKKVKVFILMGQSNMVGMGDIEPEGTNGTLTTLVKKAMAGRGSPIPRRTRSC